MNDALTVIVPIYNEEESLASFFGEMDRFLERSPMPVKVLCVNDGSTDSSLRIIKDKVFDHPAYGYISLDRNRGLSSAIKAGFDQVTTSLTGYIDADLQTNPSDFLKYFKYFPDYEMVNGIRRNRQDSLVKRLSSTFANRYRRMMIDDGIQDTCCPLKIIKTETIQRIPFFIGMHRFLPALVQLQGGKVKEIPISHYPRYAGTPKYNLRNRLIGPFFDTLAFRWMRRRYIRYAIAEEHR